jgi:ATP-dependent DNA helicase RecG
MEKRELKELIEQGEGYFVEFKEQIGVGLDKEMVAFANASGGKIVIGVTDRGKIIGCTTDNTVRSKIQDIANNCDPRIPIHIETVRYEGVKLLVVSVDESFDKPVRCSKGFFLREGPNSQKLTRNEILALAAGAGKFKFDMQPCRNFNYPENFKDTKWRHFLDTTGIAPPENSEDLLTNLGFAEDKAGFRITNAGALFFGRDIEFHIRHNFITCVLFKGTTKTKILDRKDFKVDLLSNYENAFRFLQQHLKFEYLIEDGGPRKEIPEIPLEVLREGLVNAIVHRDYYEEGAGILVEIYDNRVEIINPGRLLFDKSKFGKLSVARNPIIFDAFYRLGITEKIGSGINRMREAMTERGIKIAFDTEDFFIVTLTRPETTQKEVTPQVIPQVTPQVTPQALSDVELRILGFCHEERSASEIINFTGMNPDYIRKDIIPKLIKKGFLVLTIPNKPRSPHQKYILTEAGMKHVKTM